MYQCPECALKLHQQTKINDVSYMGCRNCMGHMMTFPVLKRAIGDETANLIWRKSEHAISSGRPCPGCTQPMRKILQIQSPENVEVDVCRRCYLIWMDQGELVDFNNIAESRKKVQMNPEDLQKYADSLAELTKEKVIFETNPDGFFSSIGPDAGWKWLPAIFGLPIEINPSPILRQAIVTYSLALMIVLTVALSFKLGLEHVVQNFGFKSIEPMRHNGFTFISSFFLHGGILHLLGNLYYFLIFSDDVEDDLGHWSFLQLVIASHISGVLFQWAYGGTTSVPLVGASAGVFGILAYYMVRFPKAKVGVMYLIFFKPLWIRFDAQWLLLFKIVWEIVLVTFVLKISTGGGVAHAAHIGGAVVGLFFGFLAKKANE